MSKDKERRREPRANSSLPLEIYDPKGRMVVAEGRFLNLSTMGGMVESPKPFKNKTPIRLHLIPAGKTALEIIGKIVWTRKSDSLFTYGVRFSAREPSPAH